MGPQLNHLGWAATPGGWADARRMSRHCMFLATDAGALELEFDDGRVVAPAGTGVLVPAGAWYARRYAHAGEARRYWIVFDWAAGRNEVAGPRHVYAEEAAGAAPVERAPGWVDAGVWRRPLPWAAGGRELFVRMNERFHRGTAVERGATRGLLLQFLHEWLAPWADETHAPGAGGDERVLAALRELAEQPFGRAASVRDVLAALGASYDHQAREFRASYGLTPLAYVNRLRVDRAKGWLRDTRLGIDEIARRMGFADFRYFGRLFRKETGMSPREFRASLRHTP